MKTFRHRTTSTLSAPRTTQRQIWFKINSFLTAHRLVAVPARAQIRQKALEFEQPYLEIAQHCLEILRRLRDRFKARQRHPKQIVVCLVRWRKINEQIAHVRKARKK